MSTKVLVVDDSLFMRTLVSDMLNSEPAIEVIGRARNGGEALKKVDELKPDVITLDLVMPGWDGLTTLKHIMRQYPTPVVILSAHSKEGADITMKCLNAGAVGFVLKPSGELSLDIEKIEDQLIKEVKAAAKVKIPGLKPPKGKKPSKRRYKLTGINEIIIIGASTGGPQTLGVLLSSLRGDFPIPVVVLQHMPTRFFTESLAEYLNTVTELEVKVADNNEVIQAGKVYFAPGGFRMTLKAENKKDTVICLSEDKHDNLSPSIDITMKSVAQIYEGNAIGIILTGMGDDGVEGMRAIKEVGGKTIAQDESSLIFGMPKAVIEAGYADRVLPMNKIARAMLECIS